jgi:hypothetical protein
VKAAPVKLHIEQDYLKAAFFRGLSVWIRFFIFFPSPKCRFENGVLAAELSEWSRPITYWRTNVIQHNPKQINQCLLH